MMLRWNAVLLMCFVPFTLLRAGGPVLRPYGAAAAGMGYAVTSTPGHWNSFNNQALLTSASSASFSASLENRFTVPALSTKAVSAILAFKPAPVGIVISHYGNADYYMIFTGVASAVELSPDISLGLQVDYFAEHGIGEYRDVSHVTFETGLACNLSGSLAFGIHLFNPVAPLNTLPSSIEAGLQWKQSDDLLLALNGSKVSGEPLSVQCGLSWNILEKITIRSGYISSPAAFAFGMGFKTNALQADAGFTLNGMTGISSALTITWTIK